MIEDKLVVLGGSFDPIHKAHLHIALQSARQIGATKAIFVPAHLSPLKGFAPLASDEDRLTMLNIALEEFPLESEVCSFELEQKSTSYTINTAKFLAKKYKNIYWIIGSDQYEQLHKWKDIEELCSLINFALVVRPNYAHSNAFLPANIKLKEIHCPQFETSSTEIREKLAKKDFLNVEISEKLVLYIKRKNLYQL